MMPQFTCKGQQGILTALEDRIKADQDELLKIDATLKLQGRNDLRAVHADEPAALAATSSSPRFRYSDVRA
jgi:hypothetical protein